MLAIGLFGTCGKSKWRKAFIKRYKKEKIPYYNPQVDDWKPECAIEEAKHLAEDAIILFPVTGETYGLGSLAETGFSILNAIKLDDRRDVIIMIEINMDTGLVDKTARRESIRSRVLVLEHLKKLNLPNVYLVDTFKEMLEVSIKLYRAAKIREPLKKYNPQNRQDYLEKNANN